MTNAVKFIKCQTYVRASFDLLRQRVLGAANVVSLHQNQRKTSFRGANPMEGEIEGGGRRKRACDPERRTLGGTRLSGFAFGVAFSA